MSNETVEHFYDKPVAGYIEAYRLDHGPRLQAVLDRYGLKESLKGKRVVDIGGGLGFLGELLDPSTDYWVIDGANVPERLRLCKGEWAQFDLDHDQFGSYRDTSLCGPFDVAFCQETLEHIGNPHHALVEIKRLVKEGGEIYLSVPTETVWHNTPYPTLLWPQANFLLFLGQMALEVTDKWTYEPKGRGWPAYEYRCINRPWSEKRLLFPKGEAKFRDCTVLEATNL